MKDNSMSHDDETGIMGTYDDYADSVADALAATCVLAGALCLLALGFVAGWMVWG